MFVVVDIEWANNDQNHQSLTQLAAAKLDDNWRVTDTFSTLIRPQNASFEDWAQVCYNGGSPEVFRQAPAAIVALSRFEAWLSREDILLFWYGSAIKMFCKMYRILFKKTYERKCLSIGEKIIDFLKIDPDQNRNPYQLAKWAALKLSGMEHISQNDVAVIVSILWWSAVPPSVILAPPASPTPARGASDQPHQLYQYNLKGGLLHKRGSSCIPHDAILKGYGSLRACIKKGFRPCPVCLQKEMDMEKRRRNRELLENVPYQYVFLPDSPIFHRRSCPNLVYATQTIEGCMIYEKAIGTGRTPCRFCKPIPTERILAPKKRKTKTKSKLPPAFVVPVDNEGEKRAIGRYNAAKNERDVALRVANLTEIEKRDIYTLTQPEFAFWSAPGYRTFHIRSCGKLSDMTHLKGFKQYDAAIAAGYVPCKQCRPTRKHDVAFSIPITNRSREDEDVEVLESFCRNMGYFYYAEKDIFTVRTLVGEWKIYTNLRPVKVDHNNLTHDGGYHRQPRVFLSLYDTIRYIHKHDESLLEKKRKH